LSKEEIVMAERNDTALAARGTNDPFALLPSRPASKARKVEIREPLRAA
jgi:hypothetical protein